MVAALHQERRAAERERLLDLAEDDRLRQDVALARVARLAIEGAEVAVGHADVRVVDVPVDDERDLVGIRPAPAQLVRGGADRDQVARAQQRDGRVVRQPFAVERAREDLGDGAVGDVDGHVVPQDTGSAASAKRSGGAVSTAPIAAAIW